MSFVPWVADVSSGGDGEGSDPLEVKRLQQELAKAKSALEVERALRGSDGDAGLSTSKLKAMPLDVRREARGVLSLCMGAWRALCVGVDVVVWAWVGGAEPGEGHAAAAPSSNHVPVRCVRVL